MADTWTEEHVKRPIEDVLGAEEYKDLFSCPDSGPCREYPLFEGSGMRAHFALTLPHEGWLFIEDNDAKRAPVNLIKYWMWMKEHAVKSDVFLIHIIGPGYPDYRRLCEFIQGEIKRSQPGFRYTLILTKDWEEPTWQERLRATLDSISWDVRHALREQEAQAEDEGTCSIEHEPFVGMWRDREEMSDSAAWVREVREKHWRTP